MEPVRPLDRLWPDDQRPGIPPDHDCSCAAAWWLAGIFCGLFILAVLALVDTQDQMIDKDLLINSLRIEKNGIQIKDEEWVCSRPSVDAKREGLIKSCISKSGV
jgi:hypothetical protein